MSTQCDLTPSTPGSSLDLAMVTLGMFLSRSPIVCERRKRRVWDNILEAVPTRPKPEWIPATEPHQEDLSVGGRMPNRKYRMGVVHFGDHIATVSHVQNAEEATCPKSLTFQKVELSTRELLDELRAIHLRTTLFLERANK